MILGFLRKSETTVKRSKRTAALSAALHVIVLFLLLAAPAQAQQQQQQRQGQLGPWILTVEGGIAWQGDADLEDTEGSFSVGRWFLSAGIDYAWNRRTSLGISFGAGENNYDFNDLMSLGAPEPWGKVEDQRLSLTARFGFGETGSFIVIPTYRYNGEPESDASDARTWGVLAGAAWRINEGLTIGPGIGVFSQLEASTQVFPILLIDWDIGERWNLSTGRGLAASQGPGLTLSYGLSPAWSFELSGRYENVRFRLDEDGPAPNGIGRDQSLPLVLSARWQANQNIGLAVFAGAEFAGELQLRNPAGEILETSDYKTAPLAGLTFEFRY